MNCLMILCLLVLCSGCVKYSNAIQTSAGTATYNVVVIDGCEYLSFTREDFTHKGNCTNEIHPINTPQRKDL